MSQVTPRDASDAHGVSSVSPAGYLLSRDNELVVLSVNETHAGNYACLMHGRTVARHRVRVLRTYCSRSFITSTKEILFLPEFVCLSVCQQDNFKSYGRVVLKFSGNVGNDKKLPVIRF